MLTIQASSVPLIALSASYMHDDTISLLPYLQQWDDGNITFSNPIFSNIRDVDANKDTILYMTSGHTIDSIVEDSGVTVSESIGSGTVALIANNGNYMSVVGTTLYASATSIGTNEQLGLLSNDDGTVSFIFNNTYLTVDPSDAWNVKLTNDATLLSYDYHKYTLDAQGSNYVIQTVPIGTGSDGQTAPLIKRYLKSAFTTGPLRATGTTRTGNSLFTLANVTAGGGVIPEQTYTGFSPNSWWIKYHNTINNEDAFNDTLEPDLMESVSGLSQNYLVNLPYKTKISTSKYNSDVTLGGIEVDFNTLKTIETPEYKYRVKYNKEGSDKVKLREYDKIFTGTNQDFGYENPLLGFTSDTKEVIFRKDSSTYFHYPRTAQQLALSASGITQDGALAGSSPFKSDKIWKKNANYKKNIWWGDSLQWQHGTWLCSWLSGSMDGTSEPVWKDRWYNPGYISASGALVSTPVSSVVLDEDSSMTFDPGVWYSYDHIGETLNKSIVGSLTGTDGSQLKLHYDDWDANITDLSPYSNNGTIENYTDSSVVTDKIRSSENQVLSLNGKDQYCNTPFDASYDVTENLTHSVWVYADDWTNVEGNHIISNNFRGGWSLSWTNGFVNPLLPIFESTYGHLLFMNINNKVNVSKLLPPLSYNPETPPYSNPVGIVLDDDKFTWIIDNEYKKLYKIDYNGDITQETNFLSGSTLQDITIDPDNNIWVLESGQVSGVAQNGLEVTTTELSPTLYWAFNGNTYDEGTANNDGVPRNMELTRDYSGICNAAYTFGGNVTGNNSTADETFISAYLGPQTDTSVFGSGGEYTFSYWFKASDIRVDSSNGPVVYTTLKVNPETSEGAADPSSGLYVSEGTYLNNGNLEFVSISNLSGDRTGTTVPAPANIYRAQTDSFIEVGNWYNVTEVYKRNTQTFEFYVNGELGTITSTIGTLSSGYITDAVALTVGRRQTSVDKTNFDGDISNFMIFDHALSASEVEALYNDNWYYHETSTVSSIDVTSQGILRGFDAEDVCFDNRNYPYLISGGDVFKGKTNILSVGNASNVACDKDDNIWVLAGNRDYYKIDDTGSVTLSGIIGATDVLGSRDINFTNEYVGGQYIDYAWIIQSADNTVYKYDMDGNEVLSVNLADNIDTENYLAHDRTIMDFGGKGDFTGYDKNRKFNYNPHCGHPQIQSKIVTEFGNSLTEFTMEVSAGEISDGWHHFATTYDSVCGTGKFYIDTLLVNSISAVPGSEVYYNYDNSLTIGVESGIFRNLSDELDIDNYYFKGKIDDLRIYNQPIVKSDLENIYMTRLDFYDIIWNMPTGNQNFIEEVERFFKNKLPGMKAQYFNIRIGNLGINNQETRNIIEEIIRDTVKRISPVHTELYNIIWD